MEKLSRDWRERKYDPISEKKKKVVFPRLSVYPTAVVLCTDLAHV